MSSGLPPTYRASVVLVATQPPQNLGGVELMTPPPVDPRVYQGALLEGDIAEKVLAQEIGRTPTETEVEEFRQRMRVNVENQLVSSVVRLSVTDRDPVQAASYADELAKALMDWDRNRAVSLIENGIAALERSIMELDAELVRASQASADPAAQSAQALTATLREQRVRDLEAARARSASAVVVGALDQLSPADVPERAIGPRLVFNTFIAAVLGLVAGYFLQLLWWTRSDELRDSERLASVTGLPVLAEYPRLSRRGARDVGEAGSFLRASILREVGDVDQLVVGVTAPTSYLDKLGVASTLAERFAISGFRTLLVDADLRKGGPGVGLDTEGSNVPGMSAYLLNPERPVKPLQVMLNQQFSFDLIPTVDGVGRPSELLEYGFKEFLDRSKDAYEVVILDLPPALSYADASTVATFCSGIVICASVESQADEAREAAALIERNQGKVLGSVLTGVTSPKPAWAPERSSASASAKGPAAATQRTATKRADAKAFARVRQR